MSEAGGPFASMSKGAYIVGDKGVMFIISERSMAQGHRLPVGVLSRLEQRGASHSGSRKA
jgi:hypothetical protein